MPTSKSRTNSGTFYGSSNFSGSRTGGSHPASAYKNVSCNLQQKINSFRTLFNQTKGAGNTTNCPSPTTINTFANWVNKGAVIQTVSPTQITKWWNSFSRSNTAAQKFNVNTTNGCKQFLCKRFGKNAIKAVTKAKNGQWLIATTPTVNGKTFNFPGC